jgi:hypothetical protein
MGCHAIHGSAGPSALAMVQTLTLQLVQFFTAFTISILVVLMNWSGTVGVPFAG